MGYNAFYFSHLVKPWLDAGWLKPQGRLIDFGAQEFHADAEEVRREVGGFLAGRGLAQDEVAAALGEGLPRVSGIYAALAIDYLAIDVDGAHGSLFFDLNTFAPPPSWRDAFDFVNNEGTIEHLVNPINGFHVAHELAKVGGVIRHSFPLIGWREHGFLYPTTKFYAHMIGDNGYELLKAGAILTQPEPFVDPLFKVVIDESLEKVVAPSVTNIWGELIYRKTLAQPFVIPVDHLGAADAPARREVLVENHRRTARARIC